MALQNLNSCGIFPFLHLIVMRLLLFVLLSFPLLIQAQEKKNFVINGIVCDLDGVTIPAVKVFINDQITFTDENGEYNLDVYNKTPLKITFKHVGFLSKTVKISDRWVKRIKENDTLKFKRITLDENTLEEFTVFSKKIDTIYGNTRFSVEDYELIDDNRMILLLYEKNLSKGSKIVLANNMQQMIHSFIVPGKAVSLYKDFANRVFVITDNGIFYIQINANHTIDLLAVDEKDFYGFYHRVIDTLENQFFYSNYNELYPEVRFYATLKNDTSHFLLREVKDDFMMELYRAQFKYVSGRDKLWAYRKEQETGIDKEIWIGAASFTQDILYQPVYAPLFVKNDTVLIFDHYNDMIFKYDVNREQIDSVTIKYHHENKKDKWNEPLLQDEILKNIFGLFHKGGITILKSIDIHSGKPNQYFELGFKYVEKVKVIDGYVYYIYRPFESIQKKFLYREKIKIN